MNVEIWDWVLKQVKRRRITDDDCIKYDKELPVDCIVKSLGC